MIAYDKETYFDFDYENALKYDSRSFLLIYWDYIRCSHIIINTFFYEIYLELRYIKIIFLFFTFGMEFFLNAIFYTDDYVSKVYSNNGVLDFFSGLPKSVYSFLMCIFINIFLHKLSNSKNKLKEVLNHKIDNNNNYNYKKICNNILMNLKKKLIIFLILIFLLYLFFFYYVSCFCAVYHNNQKLWFYGSVESILIGIFLPFFTLIFNTILRYISIKCKCKLLYKLVSILDIFL